MSRSDWTHAICAGCWDARNPGREPIRLRKPPQEPCCFCGFVSDDGIYVRADPETVPLCRGHEDAAR